MIEPKTSTAEITVRLVRPGVDTQEYRLAEGATLADLLRMSDARPSDPVILIDGVPIEETVTLADGAVVTVTPRSEIPGNEPWRATIPAFQDDALFEEYMEILKAQRQEAYPGEDEEA